MAALAAIPIVIPLAMLAATTYTAGGPAKKVSLGPSKATIVASFYPLYEFASGKVLVLSPVERIEQEEQDVGIGYIDKMKEDVANLKVGLECK